jgi:hypothetical protein
VRQALTFTIPKASWLTSNRHGIHRGQRARIVRDLHELGALAATVARLRPIDGPVSAEWTVRYPKGVSWKHGDAANAQPTTKALLDSLVPRWLPDDGPMHVTSETFVRGPNLDRPGDHEITLALTTQP